MASPSGYLLHNDRKLSDQLQGASLDAAGLGGLRESGRRGPILALNALATETDKSEQAGFSNLLVGVFGAIRNPLAHAQKIVWPMAEQDALDFLTVISLVHRKLDGASVNPRLRSLARRSLKRPYRDSSSSS